MPTSGGSYRLSRSWSAGESSERRATVGPFASDENEKPNGIGLLRVGYSGGDVAEAIDAYVLPADAGTKLGPIDVPFMLVCEIPATVYLKPAGSLRSPVDVVLSVSPVGAPSDRLYATRTIVAAAAQVVPLPQWVRGVGALSAASFIFRDRAAANLSVALTGAHDRPAAAVDVLVAVAGTLVLYY